jgi:hypothetical protein
VGGVGTRLQKYGEFFNFKNTKCFKVIEHRQMHLVGQSSSSRRELKVQANVEMVEVSTSPTTTQKV